MTHFELFELTPGFRFDKKDLQHRYLQLQKKYHPDYYGQADTAEQEEAMQLSTQVNDAYKILQNENACIKYVLQLHNAIEEEEKYALDPDFLMEVMELNEMKMDDALPEELKAKSLSLLEQIGKPVEHYLQKGITTPVADDGLALLKAYYYQKKYIDRLLAE